jgi:hypothetical protein
MRIGLSPTRHESSAYRPARVTVCLLVHIPEQAGYYRHKFEALKLCIGSLIASTDGPYDLQVFDNGSCAEVVEYLRTLSTKGVIRYLVLSAQNIGKVNAWQLMFASAPGEVIAYSDDDVLFHPGWMRAHLEILDRFPHVGMVSGVAVRNRFTYADRSLPQYLRDNPGVSVARGHFIPDEWERDFIKSTGGDVERGLEVARRAHQDIVVEHEGLRAYFTATHFQFVAFKATILRGLAAEWEPRLMAGELDVERRLDEMGLARLATCDRFVQHIGNVVTREIITAAGESALSDPVKAVSANRPWYAPVTGLRVVRAVLRRVADWSFFLLNTRRSE